MAEDPEWIIYPVGDSRNPDDPGAGMGGKDREAVAEAPVPGESFSLNASIDEETCNTLYGEGGFHSVGSELFQTVGFMGGQVTAVGSYWRFQVEGVYYYSEEYVEGATLVTMYTVETPYGDAFVPACDHTEYSIGQWVALAKIGTEFPVDEFEERVPVTNANVPEVDIEEYVIVPYQFVGM